MIALYTDEGVRGQIVRELRKRGVNVLTAVEDGREGSPDSAVLDRAGELGRLIYAEDDDFLSEAAGRQLTGTPFIGVVYAHPLQVSIGQCVRNVEIIAKLGTVGEFANRVEFLSQW